MAHDVVFTLPERSLGKADIEFKVKKNGSVVGRLNVSKGAIVWVPKNASYGYRLNWSDFAALMEKHGKHEKR